MALRKDASAIDLLELMEQVSLLTTLFVDQSDLCQSYLKNNPWILDESEVFSVDEAMVDIFQVKKVPSYRLWIDGSEVLNLVGTCSREVVLEYKEKHFGNLSLFPKAKTNSTSSAGDAS